MFLTRSLAFHHRLIFLQISVDLIRRSINKCRWWLPSNGRNRRMNEWIYCRWLVDGHRLMRFADEIRTAYLPFPYSLCGFRFPSVVSTLASQPESLGSSNSVSMDSRRFLKSCLVYVATETCVAKTNQWWVFASRQGVSGQSRWNRKEGDWLRLVETD